MITRHFQDELARLKELGAEFSVTHPALAPMLGGPSTDPDVERLLEGVAFQTALLRQKLYPPPQGLSRQIWPLLR